MKKAMRIAGLIAAGSLLGACSLFQGSNVTPSDIQNYTWVLASINGETPVNNRRMTINFEPESENGGRVYGIAQCNRYFGSYTMDKNDISFGPIGGTMMACAPDATVQETAFMTSLETLKTIKLDDKELVLRGPNNKLTFWAEAARLNGQIYFQGTLPAGTELFISLQDISKADAAAEIIAEKVMRLDHAVSNSVPFALAYAPQRLNKQSTYAIRVEAVKDGNMIYTTTARTDVSFDTLVNVNISAK